MATRPDLEGKLTPAARQALDELVDDFRDQIILGAAESASRFGDLREIAVHDILSGVNRQRSRLLGAGGPSLQRALRAYVVVGVLTGVIGLSIFAGKELLSGRRMQEQLPLLIALSGFLVAALSYLVLSTAERQTASLLKRPIGDLGAFDPGSYLMLWRDIELALRGAVAVRLGESAANTPISRLIEQLGGVRGLSAADQTLLRRLLVIRNALAHSEQGFNEAELAAVTSAAKDLLARLRALSSVA